MARKSAGLNIAITADAKQASATMKKLGQDVEQIGETTKKARDAVGTLVGLYAGAKFFQGTVDEAASLAEAQNSVNVVFAEGSDIVRQFASSSTDAFGISERAALQAANGYGLLLTNMGVGKRQAAEWSTELVGLASDLAAFSDLPLDQALGALRSGLSGESEPLKAFGVRLTEAKVKAEAMAQGLYSGTGAISDQARAAATYAIILKDTTTAQGTYERESDGLKQQTQALTAEWQNAQAKLGAELIPAMKLATQVAGGMLDVWGALPGPVQASVLALGGVALVAPKIVSGFRSAVAASEMFRLGLMGVTQEGAGAANSIGALINRAGGLGTVMGVAGIAAVGFGAILYGWQDNAANSKRRADELAASIDALSAAAEAAGRTVKEQFTAENLVDIWAKGKSGFESWGISLKDLEKGLTGTGEEYEAFVAKVRGAIDDPLQEVGVIAALGEQRKAFEGSTEQVEIAKKAKEELGLADKAGAGAADENTAAIEQQKSATERLTEAIKARYDAVQKEWDLNEARKDAARELAEAREAEAQAIADAERTSEVYRDAQRAVDDALRGVADAERGVRDAREGQVDALNSVRDAQQRLNEARREAVVRLIDLHQAAQEAATAEAGAVLALERARKEAERTAASGADGLARREAQQKVREAEDALSAARIDGKKAADEYALAERQGVEGAPGVVAAKKAIVDANKAVRDANERVADSERSVRDATERVADAQKAQRKVAVDTAKAREEASRRVKEAMFREAEAIADVSAETKGATQGVIDHIAALLLLRQTVAPGSQLYNDLSAFMMLLSGVLPGGQVAQGNQSLANAEWEIAKGASSSAPVRGSNVTINNNNTYVGTPKTQRAAQEAASKKSAVDLLRGN